MLIQCTMSCSGGNVGFLNIKYTHSVKDHPRHTLSQVCFQMRKLKKGHASYFHVTEMKHVN